MMLVLHVLMLSLLCGGLAQVVEDFESTCGQFFANGKSPTKFSGPQYKQICQTQGGVPCFATFYDTDNKIPVYSAYVFEGLKGCKRKNKWSNKPELVDDKADSDLAQKNNVRKRSRGELQALDEDYSYSNYDRGHLFPVYLASSQACADATFTLTNAAPQAKYFNSVLWQKQEKNLPKKLGNCSLGNSSAYIVTGVVPGTGQINETVNLPSHFWYAFCCLDQNKRCSHSGGVIGTNDNNSNITEMNVTDLERELSELYKTDFKLFK